MKKSCESCPGERKRFKIGERETVIGRFWNTHTDTQTHTRTHTGDNILSLYGDRDSNSRVRVI